MLLNRTIICFHGVGWNGGGACAEDYFFWTETAGTKPSKIKYNSWNYLFLCTALNPSYSSPTSSYNICFTNIVPADLDIQISDFTIFLSDFFRKKVTTYFTGWGWILKWKIFFSKTYLLKSRTPPEKCALFDFQQTY